jgi:hypothetical protein
MWEFRLHPGRGKRRWEPRLLGRSSAVWNGSSAAGDRSASPAEGESLVPITQAKYVLHLLMVERHIAQINELGAIDAVATGRDRPRQRS